MSSENNRFNNIGIDSELDMPRIRHLMKIGITVGIMALIGDMLLDYGAVDAEISGIPAAFARYLAVPDGRILWSAIFGMIGIPLECPCYFAVYRLIVQGSGRYAHTYRTGILGCLVFGGCGVHVLKKGGNDVTLLARGGWKDILEKRGLVIRHYLQRKTTTDKINVTGCLNPDDEYDIIFVVMQADQVPDVLPAVAANVSRYVVFIGNQPMGGKNRDCSADGFPCQKGGCFWLYGSGRQT